MWNFPELVSHLPILTNVKPINFCFERLHVYKVGLCHTIMKTNQDFRFICVWVTITLIGKGVLGMWDYQ